MRSIAFNLLDISWFIVILYYVAMGVYNAKWVKCNLELRFWKNENFKIYLVKSKLGKWISGLKVF